MRFFVLTLFISLIANSLPAQNKFSTINDQSPIIKGVSAKVKYESSQKKTIDLPDYLIPYLSGLLILNEKEPTEIDHALDIWIQKYGELKSNILLEEKEAKRNQAIELLNRGNFPEVERLLGIHSDYQNLQDVFPNSFMTKGKDSPIIVGDYASVTYAVNTIIEYKLPETLTVNLLNQLYRKEDQVVKLNRIIDSREVTLRRWINQYQELELQLQKTPSAIAQEAYRYFQAGDLKKTLEVLERLSGTEKDIAQARLLKAKLLMLDIKAQNLEESLHEIEKSFEVCIALDPNFQVFSDFGIFLADYRGNYLKATNPLTNALKLASNPKEKVEALLYLGYSYNTIKGQTLLAEKYLKEGLAVIKDLPEEYLDSALIANKIKILGNLSQTSTAMNRQREAMNYSKEAIELINTLPTRFLYESLKADLLVGQARSAAFSKDLSTSKEVYEKAIGIYERIYLENKEKTSVRLANAYLYYSELIYLSGNAPKAIEYLKKARKLVEPYLSSQSPSFIYVIQPFYDAQLRAHKSLNQKTDILELIKEFDQVILPLKDYDLTFYESYAAAAKKERGTIYLDLGDKSKALPYLEQAFFYYKSNLSLNPNLFIPNLSDCFLKISSVLYSQNERKKAVNFCKDALGYLASVSKFDSVNYMVFKILAYNQLAELYYNYEQNDSSFYYAKKGFESGKEIVIRSPEYYFQSFQNSANYMTLSLRKSKRLYEAINVYKNYLITTHDVMKYNAHLKQYYWSNYIYYTKYLGDTYIENKDYQNGEIQYIRAKTMLESDSPLQQKMYTFQYGVILEALALYCNNRSADIKKKRVAKLYRERKCEYARKSREIFKQFPPNNQLQNSIFNMSKLLEDCL